MHLTRGVCEAHRVGRVLTRRCRRVPPWWPQILTVTDPSKATHRHVRLEDITSVRWRGRRQPRHGQRTSDACVPLVPPHTRQVCTFSADAVKLRVTAAGAEFMFYFPTHAAVEEFCSLLLLLDPLKEVTDDCEFMYVARCPRASGKVDAVRHARRDAGGVCRIGPSRFRYDMPQASKAKLGMVRDHHLVIDFQHGLLEQWRKVKGTSS